MQAIVIKQQVSLRKCGCTHTCWTKKYYLPACVTISSKALCADDLLPSTISVLYLLSRVHVYNCWYHWHSLAISIPFSLCPVKESMSVALIQAHHYAQQVSVWTTGPTRTCSSSYTGKPKDSWLHSYRPIAIIQQLSPRKSGRTRTSPSPLCKMPA
jgi:hypothetical protein